MHVIVGNKKKKDLFSFFSFYLFIFFFGKNDRESKNFFIVAIKGKCFCRQVCKKKQWSAVFRDVTETNFAPGAGPKNFYTRLTSISFD